MNKSVGVGVAIGAVVVVGAAYAGATAWAGQKTQARYQEQVAKVQGQYPFLKVGEQRYQKGFFSSTNTMSFQIGCPSADGKPAPSIVVVDTIHHGPIAGGSIAAAVIDSQIGLGGEPGQRAAAMFGGAPLTAHTVVGFAGNYSSTVHSPAAKIPVPAGAEVAWLGLDGTVEGSADARDVSYRMKSPGLSISDPAHGALIKVSALEMHADQKAINGSGLLKVGKADGSLGAMEMTIAPPAGGASAARPMSAMLTAVKFNSETSVTDDLLGGTGTLSGAGAVDGTKIDKVEMKVSMKRIHAPTYQRLVETMSKANPGCDAAGKAAADPAAMLAKLQADLAALLQFNPEFALDQLAVDYGGQRGELAYAVAMQGVTPSEAQTPLMLLLMQHGHATASARLPVAWIRQLSQASSARLQGTAPDPAMVDVMIDQMAAQGYLVRDGEFVKSSAEFAGGQLKVNGKSLGGPPGGAPRPGT